MLKSGWRYVFAFGGVGILAGIFAAAALLTSSPQLNRESGAKQSNVGRTEQKGFTTVARPIEPVEQRDGSEEKWPCNPGQDNRNSDLCAQWKAADSASDAAFYGMLSLVVGIFGTFGLLVNIIYTHRAVSVADKAVVESRRMGEVQARAYIQIVSSSSKAIFDKGSRCYFPEVEVVVKNTGQTPARDVKIVAIHSKVWRDSVSFPEADAIDAPGTNILEIGSQGGEKLVLSPLGDSPSREWIDSQIAAGGEAAIVMKGSVYGLIIFDDVFEINRTIRFNSEIRIIIRQDGAFHFIPEEFRFWRLPDEEARPADRWKKVGDKSWVKEHA